MILRVVLVMTCIYCSKPQEAPRNISDAPMDIFDVPMNLSGIPMITSDIRRFISGHERVPKYAGPVEEDETFDFIIVGSGAAGSVLANRLTQNPEWKILLLEAGKVPTSLTDIPVLAPIFQQTDYSWGYLGEKQENMGLGLEEGRMAWPRGKVLGGSSIINHNIYTRGNKIDYDRWASLGNPGWSYDEVLPFFKKSEDSRLRKADPCYHHQGGELGVQDVTYRSPGVSSFVKAMKQGGYRYVDYNGKNQSGVSYIQATLRNGRRSSALRAFLDPAMFRPNLKILTESRVTKILIDPETKKARGVQFARHKRYHTALASKEVILSAGALNSPQLLMLSGVGPKWHLDDLGIPLIKDLPVGQKLYDHIAFLGLVFEVNRNIIMPPEVVLQPDSLNTFLHNGTGPFSHLGSMEAIAYIRTNASDDPDPNYPDVELLYSGGHLHSDRNTLYRSNSRVTQHIYDVVFKPLENKFAVSAGPVLLHPKSVGFMRLKSSNPFKWPKFYGNYFSDRGNYDVKTFVAAIREIQRIFRQPALQKYGAKLWPVPIPGCEGFVFDSDSYWECALRHLTITVHHQVGTCKMGPVSDWEAVVDARLRVHGVKNLRVIDTSVIPIPLSAHTNAPAYMVGERGADLIKEDWTGSHKVHVNVIPNTK